MVPINVIQRRAGHSDPSMTLKVYTGITKSTENLAAQTFESVLFNPESESLKEPENKIVNYAKAL